MIYLFAITYQLLLAAIATAGLWLICQDIFKFPGLKTMRTVNRIKEYNRQESTNLDVKILSFTKALAKAIPLDKHTERKMTSDLKTAKIDMTPQEFIADAILRCFPFLIIGIVLFGASRLIGACILAIGALAFLSAINRGKKRITEKRENIEGDLSRFIYTLKETLPHNPDLPDVLSLFKAGACPDFREELEIMIADMRSGDAELAILRADERIGSQTFSDVCRGLIGAYRGDDMAPYWEKTYEASESNDEQRLLRAILKVPRKVNSMTNLILMGFTALFLVAVFIPAASQLIEMFASM